MTAQFSPRTCAVAADQAIHAYLEAVGALGDAEKCTRAVGMLASKCGLALVLINGQDRAFEVLMRSAVNAKNAVALTGGVKVVQ